MKPPTPHMKKTNVVPRDVPRDFRANEMFFSTTDPRGVITSGNEAFVRISGYSAEQLVGRAHNIIRHPDMPRAAFQLVWDYLKRGQRPAALVKNLARDGCYYWVVALIAPSREGYLSIRFKPTSPLVGVVADVYARMVAEEERLLANGESVDAAMAASTRILLEAVNSHGFPDYDAFMRTLLCDELKSRDAVLQRSGESILAPLPAERQRGSTGSLLRALHRRGEAAYALLSRLYLRLDEFVELQRSLEGKASFVDNLTRELRLAAMNASLASARAGSQAASLGVVSQYMGNASTSVAGAVGSLNRDIRNVSDRLRAVIFNLAAGRLQIEMILGFLHELISAGSELSEHQSAAHAIRTLQHGFRFSLDQASQALQELRTHTREMNPTARNLSRFMLELQVAQLFGAVETTRLSEKTDFHTVFLRIRELIDETRSQLAGLSDALGQLDTIAVQTPAAAREIAESAAAMESESARVAEQMSITTSPPEPAQPPEAAAAAERSVATDSRASVGERELALER